MNWSEICNDRSLQDLPYKIELNKEGKIVMSPTRNRHGYLAGKIACLLKELLKDGEILVEVAVETVDSTKVADVAWAAPSTFAIIKEESSCSVAPEICVEVQSPGNSKDELVRKRHLYFQAGAKEFWLCNQDGQMEFFDGTAQIEHSRLCPEFPARLPV